MSFRSFERMKDPGVSTPLTLSSIPRKRESGVPVRCPTWIPAFAGMTEERACSGTRKRVFQTSESTRGFLVRIVHCATIGLLILFAAGCDPVLNIGGTFFPGWMASILIGSALSVAIRYLFVFTGLEPHVGPLALIYTSLGVLLSVVSWLILYRS